MRAFETYVAVIMAAVLLWAGLAKLTNQGGITSTVQALGVPAKWSMPASNLVSLWEIVTAFGVLFAPSSPWTLVGVATLGVGFALAGLVAVLRNDRIRCNCFGSGMTGGHLGRAQVIALPAWVGGVLLLYNGHPNVAPFATGASLFAATGLTIATLKTVALWQEARAARGDRLSAQEMYVWLPQH